MKNAAMICGLIGGFLSLFVGFYGAGSSAISGGSGFYQMVSLSIPVLAIVGGAIALANQKLAGILMGLSVVATVALFNVNIFTGVPVALVCAGAIMALTASPEAKE